MFVAVGQDVASKQTDEQIKVRVFWGAVCDFYYHIPPIQTPDFLQIASASGPARQLLAWSQVCLSLRTASDAFIKTEVPLVLWYKSCHNNGEIDVAIATSNND